MKAPIRRFCRSPGTLPPPPGRFRASGEEPNPSESYKLVEFDESPDTFV